MSQIYYCQANTRENRFVRLHDEEGKFYCYFDEGRYDINKGIGNYLQYIIRNRETGEIYTNIKSSHYQEVIDKTKKQKIYWNLVDGKIDTNITYINQENIKYNSYYYQIKEKKDVKAYDIYSFLDEENITGASDFLFYQRLYDFMLQHQSLPLYSCIASGIFILVIVFYLLWAIGYQKGEKQIFLHTFDTIPYEIVCLICINVIGFVCSILADRTNEWMNYYVMIIMYVVAYIVGYIACAIWGITTIKRIKARKFWGSFLSYKIIKWVAQKIMKFVKEMKQKMSLNKKIFWYYWGFVGISMVLACVIGQGMAIFILWIFWIWVYYRLRKSSRQQEEIKEALEKVYLGNKDINLDPGELTGTLKEMAVYINDIAGGFSNAMEESLKSERLKTELITNVSHDIKTPLTSIINYVDLLKKEEIKEEKIQEYIRILEMKSQRLKKLTEDLIEASKVSSGNVKLNIEEIKLKELIYQSIGEFKDRFEEKGLQIESNMPEEEIKIKADNRYLYRLVENLLSNVTKYALENSRVYIDMKKDKNKIQLSIKNISKEKLNISSDELMQRFVRGDKSRYTEGSGLGLSIAKSLTELQGGKFTIHIDGDLFKVMIEWYIAKNKTEIDKILES